MTRDLVSAFAQFATAPATPSKTALAVAGLSALDWVAVGRAGVDEPVAQALRRLVEAEGGAGQAHVFGLASRLPARAAAWLNGTTSHALDYDDTHFAHIGHPSVAIFPAALAVGEACEARLSDVLEAALIGMEGSIRFGLWLGRGHYQVGFHQTATAGTFGATMAAGRLLGLDAAAMAQALGLAATRASGLKAQFGTMGKPLNAGYAAQNGVETAQLVAAGVGSNPQAVDGAFGFGATHHGADRVAVALEGLGTQWRFETVSHKYHACCHGLHAALEAFRSLDVAAPEIARLTVLTHPNWLAVCNQPEPDTGLGAKFSYRVALAMAATGYDTAQLSSYTAKACADPRVVNLRDRIEVKGASDLPETAAQVQVLLRNGSTYEASCDLDEVRPLDERTARVAAKAGALIGDDFVHQVQAVLSSDVRAGALGQVLSAQS